MKKSVKLMGLAVLATLTLASCKNNATEAVVDSLVDSTVETLCDDTLMAVAEDTVAVADVAKPAKKAATKVEEKAPSVQKTKLDPNSKPSAKEAAASGQLKEAENNGSTTAKQLTPTGKKSAKEAFKKQN